MEQGEGPQAPTVNQQLLSMDCGDADEARTAALTLLCAAAMSGDVEQMQAIVNQHGLAMASGTDRQGQTPLFHASMGGRVPAIEWLAQNAQVNLNHTDTLEQTALFVASAKGHLAAVEALLLYGEGQGQSCAFCVRRTVYVRWCIYACMVCTCVYVCSCVRVYRGDCCFSCVFMCA